MTIGFSGVAMCQRAESARDRRSGLVDVAPACIFDRAGSILTVWVDPEKSAGPDVFKHLLGARLEPEEKLL